MKRTLPLVVALMVALVIVGTALAGSWRPVATKTGNATAGFVMTKAVNRAGTYVATFRVSARATVTADWCDGRGTRTLQVYGANQQIKMRFPAGGCTVQIVLYGRGRATITLWRWSQ